MADSHCFEGTHVEFQKIYQKAKTMLYLGIYLAHITYIEIDINH